MTYERIKGLLNELELAILQTKEGSISYALASDLFTHVDRITEMIESRILCSASDYPNDPEDIDEP